MLNVRVAAEPSALEDSPDGPVLNIRLSIQVPVLHFIGLLGQLHPQERLRASPRLPPGLEPRQQPVLQQPPPGLEPRPQQQLQAERAIERASELARLRQAARHPLLQPRSEGSRSSRRTSRSPPGRRRRSYSPQPAWSPGPEVRRPTEPEDVARFANALARLEQQDSAEARWPLSVPTPGWGQQPQQQQQQEQQQPWQQPWQQHQSWYDQQQQQLHGPDQQQQQHSSWTRHRTGQLLQYGRPFHLQ